MLVGPVTALDRVRALLAEAPGLERASELAPVRVPVLEPFERLLPDPGLRPGSTVGVAGTGSTSLALALVARATENAWTAVAGLPSLNLVAASELGVAIDRLVVVPETTLDVLAALADAFDVVLARSSLPACDARKLYARVRERDAVLVLLGRHQEVDVTIETSILGWHGIDHGHGYLRARTLSVTVSGRGGAARPKQATMWLPDEDGDVSLAEDRAVVRVLRTG
jgi:hypothetical protein